MFDGVFFLAFTESSNRSIVCVGHFELVRKVRGCCEISYAVQMNLNNKKINQMRM